MIQGILYPLNGAFMILIIGNLQLFGINHYQGNAHYMIICKNMNFR